MLNLSDKELDRLSREAADSYEPDDSSLSWSRLEQRLTEQMPGRPPDGFRFGRINPYIWAPAAVLIAGVSFFLIKNIVYSPYSTRTNQIKTQRISPGSGKPSGGIHDSSSDSLTTAYGGAADESIKKKGSDKPSASGITDKRANSVGFSKTGRIRSDSGADLSKTYNSRTALTRYPSASLLTKQNSSGSNHTAKNRQPDASLNADKTSEAALRSAMYTGIPGERAAAASAETNPNDNKISSTERPSIGLPAVAISGVLGHIKGNDSLLNQFSKAQVPAKSMHINRSLNIGFAFGPDYSNAGGIANNQISNNIGITIGYYLTGKLSVNTGIFYSNKFYWSPGKTSHPQAAPVPATPGVNYYAAPPPVQYVNGSCNMYEVPLTLRYDFASGPKTKFFANAGLSSYFMVKQTYIYFFHSGARALAWKTTDNQQQNYWMGVAALSLGMETELGKGFSFQAEPFLRLPLQTMGVENIRINSYGFLLSFRYTPVLSRSKR